MILKLIDSISIITHVTIALDWVDFNHIRFRRGLLSWNAAFPRDPHLFLFKLIGIKNNISTLRALSGMILIFLLFNISIKVHTTKPSTRAPQFCCSDMFFYQSWLHNYMGCLHIVDRHKVCCDNRVCSTPKETVNSWPRRLASYDCTASGNP